MRKAYLSFSSTRLIGLILLVIVCVVKLGGHFEDSVQYGCCVLHVTLLFLPLDIKIPKPVRVEVQTCSLNRILEHSADWKTKKKTTLTFLLYSLFFYLCCPSRGEPAEFLNAYVWER